jgi:hypothetical protein
MLQIGDFLTYEGRTYRLVGVTPMSVRPFAVQLNELTTDRVFWIEADAKQAGAGMVALTSRGDRADAPDSLSGARRFRRRRGSSLAGKARPA